MPSPAKHILNFKFEFCFLLARSREVGSLGNYLDRDLEFDYDEAESPHPLPLL